MAIVPEKVTLKANQTQILNTIRSAAPQFYKEIVPYATYDNYKEVGGAIFNYEPARNHFLSALMNRIGRVLITSSLYYNPLVSLKKGMLEFGESTEEIYVNITKAHDYNPYVSQSEVFKRSIPDVQSVFHVLNWQKFYKQTISNDQLRQALLSFDGISQLIGKIVDSMKTSDQIDEFNNMKQLIADAANAGWFYTVSIPQISSANAKDIVTTIKGYSNFLEFPSTQYNHMGVVNHTPKEDQLVLLRADFDAIIDVEVLAYAFNMSKAEFLGRKVMLDNFGTLQNADLAIVDRNFFMVYDNFETMTEIYNSEGLYWNYCLHTWKTFSVSPFSNAILFVSQAPTVTALTITPETATVAKGSHIQFTANVTGDNYPSSNVIWSINNDTYSNISSDGVLHVGEGETATTLTVTATSVQDNTKTATATATITA